MSFVRSKTAMPDLTSHEDIISIRLTPTTHENLASLRVTPTLYENLASLRLTPTLYENLVSLRVTHTPGENYRCPVSTPANYGQHQRHFVRSVTLQDINLWEQKPHGRGRAMRSRGRRRSSGFSKSSTKCENSGSSTVMDEKIDKKETQETYWLRSLCAQPVEEILDKYRRKNDLFRTRTIWAQTFTTPGERSLLNFWENNVFRGCGPKTWLESSDDTRLTDDDGPKSNTRLAQKEKPFSSESNKGDKNENAKTDNPTSVPKLTDTKQSSLKGRAQSKPRLPKRNVKGLQDFVPKYSTGLVPASSYRREGIHRDRSPSQKPIKLNV